MKRLFIDLDKCEQCEECKVECDYFNRVHKGEHGILKIREMATFSLICRRCEDASCVNACKYDALERQENGELKRYNLRCVSCKCCVHACPFGTIYPDLVPFYVTNCDYCINKADGKEPPCVASCPHGAIECKEVEPSEEDSVYLVNDSLVAKTTRWLKKDV